MAGGGRRKGEKERSFNGFAAESRIGRRAWVIPLCGRFFFPFFFLKIDWIWREREREGLNETRVRSARLSTRVTA